MEKKHKDVGGKFCVSGKIFPIYGGVNPIGRNREAVVNIKSLGVSQQHALFILVDDDLHFISDLKSSNGTFLDNRKIDPLQLYRLENGSRVKFADIEGVYSKLTLTDVDCQGNISILSENTQNFTQNFYGSDTQIMDNTTLADKNDKSSGIKNYIPSQILAEVAEELENSYIQAHEQPTQVVLSGIEVMSTIIEEKRNSRYLNNEKVDAKISNKSDVIYHEAETQVMTDQDIKENCSVSVNTDENSEETHKSIIYLHEAETQVLTDQTCPVTLQNERSDGEFSKLVHETETQLIVTDPEIEKNESLTDTGNELNEPNVQTTSLENENMSKTDKKDTPDKELEEEDIGTTSISNSNVKISQVITQDSDVVNPLGISSNVVSDTQHSFYGLDLGTSLDDSESDIIRPVKKSVNIFESQDSTFEDLRKDSEESAKPPDGSLNHLASKPECSTFEMSLDDSESDIIRPVKKSINIFDSQDSEQIEEDSNDSVDFMTMQKISNTQKYADSIEDYSKNIICENTGNSVHNIHKNYCSETELQSREIEKETMHLDEGSETEDENVETKMEIGVVQEQNINHNAIKVTGNSHSSSNEPQTTNSDTDSENKLNSSKERKKRKIKSKKKNVISDSDTDSDGELKRRSKLLAVCSDSDTDVENNKYPIDEQINGGINKENRKNNVSVGLILEESAVEDDMKISEKTEHKALVNQNTYSRLSVGNNESLNDSDFIPSTQEDNLKTVSQNSKFDNSENSFKLGLTQLMEEDDTSQPNKLNPPPTNSENITDEIVTENKKPQSGNSQETQKKFVFKKSSLSVTKSVDITLDYDQDIYEAKTQNMCEKRSSTLKDDHVFLQPTQEAPKKKHLKEDSVPDEDFYLLSTQKLDGSTQKKDIDDFYQQSTQKLTVEEFVDQGKDTALSGLSENEFYHLPTQKLSKNEVAENVRKKSDDNNSEDDDDIFATQVMEMKGSPNKYLESELEHMFATQRAIPTEDTLDKIQDSVLKKQIIDDKLPTEDKDLEAILATQKMLDSPKTSKKNNDTVAHSLGKSLESQLEVLFASQTSNLPLDKFVRPPNPLVNIFGDTQDTQELLKENSSLDNEETNEHDDSESTILQQKKTCQIGLEQSFALLEAKSTKIRRSDRNKNCEEVSVSCPKSRISMIVAPNDKKISEEDSKPIPVKTVRTTRKRQPPTVLESTTTQEKKPEKRKRRRISESTISSDEENQSNMALLPNKQNITNKILSRIQEIEDEEKLSVTKLNRPETPNRIRSSRIQRINTEENIESTTNEYAKSYRTRTSKVNKVSDPCTSNISKKDKESVKNEISTSKNKSSKSNENGESKCQKKDKLMDLEEKTATDNTDKFNKKELIINKVENEGKRMNIEEKKSSRTRNSRATKITIEEQEPLNPSNSEGKSRNKSKRVKTNEDSSDNFETEEDNIKREIVTKITKKLTENIQKQTTPSRTSKRGASIQITTPPKIQRVSEATPSRCRRTINVEDTPNRNKRKLKPKVVFTMMESPQLESQIKQLGGSVVDSVDTCTVLITRFVKRTMKLLSAIGLGKPICSEEWVNLSKKENNFLDPWDFVLVDSEAEKKWDFCLKTSLERSLQAKLFEGYTFQLLVTSAQEVLKGAIESCGGRIVTRTPKEANNFVVVAAPEQKDKYKKLLKQQSNLIVVEPEAIFDGVLRQEMRFERHLMK